MAVARPLQGATAAASRVVRSHNGQRAGDLSRSRLLVVGPSGRRAVGPQGGAATTPIKGDVEIRPTTDRLPATNSGRGAGCLDDSSASPQGIGMRCAGCARTGGNPSLDQAVLVA